MERYFQSKNGLIDFGHIKTYVDWFSPVRAWNRMEVTCILLYNTSCGTGNMFEHICFPMTVAALLTNEPLWAEASPETKEKTPGTHLSRMVIFNTLLLTYKVHIISHLIFQEPGMTIPPSFFEENGDFFGSTKIVSFGMVICKDWMQYMQRASSLRILLSAAASSCEKGFLVMRSQVTQMTKRSESSTGP